MREAEQCVAKGRVLEDTHTEAIWKGASKTIRGQTVGEVEGEPGNTCPGSPGRGFQEDS